VPTRVGSGGRGEVVDCRALADTNGDGVIDNKDTCIPIGGFINAIRPIQLALPLINAAKSGQVNVVQPTPVIGGYVGSQFAPSGPVIFQDDFSTQSQDWTVGKLNYKDGTQYGDAEYYENIIYLGIYPEKEWNWLAYGGETFSNVQISVDVGVIKQAGDGEYGIVCDLQKDGDHYDFYLLSVTEDGYYMISMYYQGEWHELTDWLPYDGINPDETATLTATCANGKLSLAYNNLLLVEVADSTLTDGYIGFYVGTYDNPNLTVGFDNLVVRQQ